MCRSALRALRVASGAAFACTDFRIHADGFSRILVDDRGLTSRQAGRTLQRLLKIDTYRMMALLALPVAQVAAPFLADCERELQNQAVLQTMNRRADIQLRLQSTVEGLLVAAVTYDIVGLVAYGAKSAAAWGLKINTDLTVGISIPVVAVLVALGLRRVHRLVMHQHS